MTIIIQIQDILAEWNEFKRIIWDGIAVAEFKYRLDPFYVAQPRNVNILHHASINNFFR